MGDTDDIQTRLQEIRIFPYTSSEASICNKMVHFNTRVTMRSEVRELESLFSTTTPHMTVTLTLEAKYFKPGS